MSDIIDQANEQADMHLQFALRQRRPTLKPIGRCHNCGEKLQAGLFCDADCRGDHDRRESRK